LDSINKGKQGYNGGTLDALLSKIHRGGGEEAISVHQNLQEPKTDDYVFWDHNLRIVFDAYSPIPSTGIDKIKDLSIICIHILFLIFIVHQASRPWLKVEFIHATE
jgi:hypothetical protein